MTLTLDTAHTALLVMDFQVPVVEYYASTPDAVLTRTSAAIAAARDAGIPVIYVVVGFRPGFPEISPRNKVFTGIKASGGFSTEIHPRVAPRGDEPVVVKHRVGAFHGTDLDMILRAQDIHTLAMCGVATSGVILSTVLAALDLDYGMAILSDCCDDPDPDKHKYLMNTVLSGYASMTTSDAFIEIAKANRARTGQQ